MGDNKFKCDKYGTYQPIGTKTIICIDCGVEVDGNVNRKVRCDECQKIINKEKTRLRVQKYRDKQNM